MVAAQTGEGAERGAAAQGFLTNPEGLLGAACLVHGRRGPASAPGACAAACPLTSHARKCGNTSLTGWSGYGERRGSNFVGFEQYSLHYGRGWDRPDSALAFLA